MEFKHSTESWYQQLGPRFLMERPLEVKTGSKRSEWRGYDRRPGGRRSELHIDKKSNKHSCPGRSTSSRDHNNFLNNNKAIKEFQITRSCYSQPVLSFLYSRIWIVLYIMSNVPDGSPEETTTLVTISWHCSSTFGCKKLLDFDQCTYRENATSHWEWLWNPRPSSRLSPGQPQRVPHGHTFANLC